MIIIANITNTIRTLFPSKQPSHHRRLATLSIQWGPLEEWQPAISRIGPANWSVDKLTARFPAKNRLSPLCAAVFVAALLAVRPAAALNGSFTNNGTGWGGLGPLTNGSPHVTTNSSGTNVLRIGKDGVVPGVPGAKVSNTGKDQCPDSRRYCCVYFHADWTPDPAGTETATVNVQFTAGFNNGPVNVPVTITESGDHCVNLQGYCNSFVVITYSIGSGGKPVQSTLDISDVKLSCDWFDHHTLAALPPRQFDDLPKTAYPLPLGGVPAGLPPQDSDTIVQRPTGLSPLANPFTSGSNWLNNVLPAEDGTILYKYDAQSGSFNSYYSSAGQWFPSGGTLGPGDAAFIDSPAPQQFHFRGQYVPMPFGKHPSIGSAYFANPVDWPMLLENVMGFKPIVGDMVVMFRHGDTHGVPPGTPDSVFIFQPDNFYLQPEIAPGETVQVFFADPSKVPIEILPLTLGTNSFPTNLVVTAPGGLPGGGNLQTADSQGTNTQWKSLMGVGGYYWEPATNGARFFRLGFNLPAGNLYGYITQSNGQPASGISVQLAPNGISQLTGNSGSFSFLAVPLGLVDLDISSPVQVFDPVTSQFTYYTVSLPLTVNLHSSVTTVAVKENFTAVVFEPPNPPACKCKPWCGIIGGSINAVPTVVAGGGPLPDPCADGVCTVTITGPGGVHVQLVPGGRRTFSPAANGVWTVTATVCGITKTASITLP